MINRIIPILFITLTFTACNKGDCNDAELNGDETAIDCGGDCAPCETCSDGIKNQDEVNVDCGGTCELCDIEYPSSGTYGTNVLGMDDTLYLSHQNYSLKAVIPEGSSLTVKLNSISGGEWWLSLGNNVGWSYTQLDAGVQFFEGLNETCDLQLDLSNMTGMFQVWYYENNESVTRVGYVYVN